MSHFKHAVVMFNGAANMARAISVHRAAVSRWESGDREILPHHQLRILQAGAERGMDLKELAWSIGVKRCKCCDEIVDDDIRDFMHTVVPINLGKAAQ
jgi:DNA-binding transcriptional regulator YdaS (Cro superfamily)